MTDSSQERSVSFVLRMMQDRGYSDDCVFTRKNEDDGNMEVYAVREKPPHHSGATRISRTLIIVMREHPIKGSGKSATSRKKTPQRIRKNVSKPATIEDEDNEEDLCSEEELEDDADEEEEEEDEDDENDPADESEEEETAVEKEPDELSQITEEDDDADDDEDEDEDGDDDEEEEEDEGSDSIMERSHDSDNLNGEKMTEQIECAKDLERAKSETRFGMGTPPHMTTGEKNHKVGTPYIRELVRFCQDSGIASLVIVGDLLTRPALTELFSADARLHVCVLSHEETFYCIANHQLQPIEFRAISGTERAAFLCKNPRYKEELTRISERDALVKYYGFAAGEILRIVDADTQCGTSVSFMQVVNGNQTT